MKKPKATLGLKQIINAGLKNPDILVKLIDEKNIDVFSFSGKLINLHGYLVANPNFIKQLHKLPSTESSFVRNILKKVLGKYSLLSVDDQNVWKKDRTVLETLFQRDVLIKDAAIIVKTIAADNTLKIHADSNTSFNVDGYLTTLIMKIVGNTIFGGTQIDLKKVPFLGRNLFHLASPRTFPLVQPFGIPMPLYFKYKNYKKLLRGIAEKVVEEAFTDNINKESHAISKLAKAYGYDSLDQLDHPMKEHLIDITVGFLMAGHDSTSSTLLNLFVTISSYPYLMDKMAEEIKTVIGSRDPNYEDLKNLTYTNAVIREALRLFPGGQAITRSLLQDAEIEGYPVKKTDIIFIIKNAILKHPKYWPNPLAFDPTRFLKPLTEDQQNLYFPFGVSSHTCIGSQFGITDMSLIIIMILQRYRLELGIGGSIERYYGQLIAPLKPNVIMKVRHLTN